VLDVGRAVLASELVGLADEVFERTVAYLQQRRQFGQDHRRVPGPAAPRRRAVLRPGTGACAGAPGAGRAGRRHARRGAKVAQAKARAGLSANRAVQEGVQMHGGIGMTDDWTSACS
jgi:acyl-CoA dehydrogenase